ncbi:Gfo/Idh/MocA family protein [Halosimplex salinum]|uniref:Gfo/Idh/MocA family protein n=1 Tax=Halosimplex salinum TaxID=1710538 RepID=UPI000F46AC45|nr:Gfo/Idh/MocA family oxidoreductase [Halosimplex salinum]
MTNVGLVGAGGISDLHRPAYDDFPEKLTLTGVCDVSEENARAFADDFGVDYWTDHETFLEEADVDAVDVTLPHSVHYEVAKAALEAGKHVHVEKPFATDLADCVELVDLAAERDLRLMVGQMQRFHPPYRALKRRVDDGDLGAIRHARCDALVNQGDLFPPGHWLYDGEMAGGGGVIGYSVHKLDLLRYYLGDVAGVSALDRSVSPDFDGAEDYATGLLEFESGTIADFSVTLSAPAMPYTEAFWLVGDDGVVHTLPEGEQQEGYVGSPTPRINTRDDPERRKSFDAMDDFDTDLPTSDAFVNELLHFADCVERGSEPLTSGRDNLGTMAAIEAIYRSAASGGERVTTEDVLAEAREGV